MDSPSSNEPLRFVIPQEVLDQAHDWQVQHGRILTMPMPTLPEPWHGAHTLHPEHFTITTLQEQEA